MENNLLVIQQQAATAQDAIAACARSLYEHGFVDAAFEQACIAREEEFPTGLAAEVGVAIPHTTAEHVHRDGICLLRLEHPVTFQRMDDPCLSVDVDFVFNLAVSDPNRQLRTLRIVMGILQDGAFLNQCKALPLHQLQKMMVQKIY